MSVESSLQEGRQGARTLARYPCSSLVVILALELGIGAKTAILRVVDGVPLEPLPAPMSGPLCAKVAGLSLHVAWVVGPADRDGPERLRRYGLRVLFLQARLGRRDGGRVADRLRRPWSNASGATRSALEPAERLRWLAALLPAPYANMVQCHGVFAGRSVWRSRMPAPVPGRNARIGRWTHSDSG
ncbi:MAG: transposase [Candidatus Eiseniibacteriota bacterium]|jgi:hypothetical protein